LTLLAAVASAAGKAAAPAPSAHASLSPQQQAILQKALATQQTAAPVVQQPHTWFQDHAGWLTHGIAGIFIIAAVMLVALLAVQTTKQEGLSGTIGGRVESSYGRPGAEEQLQRITSLSAFVFVISAFILSLTGI
jgi:preprotein translocase subunit SecG